MNENNYTIPDDASMLCNENGSHYLDNKELDECFLKFGSFLSMIQNKKMNQINYLLILIENKNIRDILLHITGIETFEELIKEMVYRCPSLCKSKLISTRIKNAKHNR